MATFGTYNKSIIIHDRDFTWIEISEVVKHYLDPNVRYDIEWRDYEGCDGGYISAVSHEAIANFIVQIKLFDTYAYNFMIIPTERKIKNVQKKD